MGATISTDDSIWKGEGKAINPADSAKKAAKKNTTLNMDDFLKILVAQYENQNLFDGSGSGGGSSNTEYVTELAQMSAIQAMNSMTQNVQQEYAGSLVGKNVVMSVPDSTTGQPSLKQGVVSKACYASDGTSYLMLQGDNDNYYDLSNVIEVTDGQAPSNSSGGTTPAAGGTTPASGGTTPASGGTTPTSGGSTSAGGTSTK